MAKRYYWRAMTDTYLNNADVGMLSDYHFRVFVLLQAIATDEDDPNAPAGYLPAVRHLAYRLRSSEGEVTEALGALANAGLVEYNEAREAWQITGWKDEQPTAGAERAAKHKAKKRVTSALPERYQNVTSGNTEQNRQEENRQDKSQNRTAAATEERLIKELDLIGIVDAAAVDTVIDMLSVEPDPVSHLRWVIADARQSRPKNLAGLVIKKIKSGDRPARKDYGVGNWYVADDVPEWMQEQ